MSDSNWYSRNAVWVAVSLYMLSLCIYVGYFGYLKGYSNSDLDHQSDYIAHYQSQINERDCIARSTTREAVQCYKEATSTAREHTRAEQDLNAQREMANWAEGMLWSSFFLGFVGIGVSGLGFYFVKRSLDAAVEANHLARFSARPWITIDYEVDASFLAENRSNSKGYTHTTHLYWQYSLKNVGESPSFGNIVKTKTIATKDIFTAQGRFEDFVETEISKGVVGTIPSGKCIFPSEKINPSVVQNEGWRWIKEEEPNADRFYFFAIVTYRNYSTSRFGEGSQFGYEARCMLIDHDPDFIGARSAKLLEFADWRRIG